MISIVNRSVSFPLILSVLCVGPQREEVPCRKKCGECPEELGEDEHRYVARPNPGERV